MPPSRNALRLCNRLRAELEERRMSQSDLAQLADLPYPRLQRLLRPGSNPALEDAFRITQVLDVPLGRLFWLENGERDSP